jgi:hypothetical protein
MSRRSLIPDAFTELTYQLPYQFMCRLFIWEKNKLLLFESLLPVLHAAVEMTLINTENQLHNCCSGPVSSAKPPAPSPPLWKLWSQ